MAAGGTKLNPPTTDAALGSSNYEAGAEEYAVRKQRLEFWDPVSKKLNAHVIVGVPIVSSEMMERDFGLLQRAPARVEATFPATLKRVDVVTLSTIYLFKAPDC